MIAKTGKGIISLSYYGWAQNRLILLVSVVSYGAYLQSINTAIGK